MRAPTKIKVLIREIELDETHLVQAMWRENAAEATGRLMTVEEAARADRLIARFVTEDHALCLVAEADGLLLGYLTGYVIFHPVTGGTLGHVEEVYVRPPARRQGVASELLDVAVTWMRALGANPVRANVCTGDEVAMGFWEGTGWDRDMTLFTLNA